MAQPSDAWNRWHSELEMARKVKGYKDWVNRGKKIVRRYRDERKAEADYSDGDVNEGGTKFNILWSNIQTLMPAVFAKSPKPVVQRRYLDRDDEGRTASLILERALLYEIDSGTYFAALRRAVLDRLLPGRGQIWVRYEPTFRNLPSKTQEGNDVDIGAAGISPGARVGVSAGRGDGAGELAAAANGGSEAAAGTLEESGDVPEQEKSSETVPIDYLDWQDFLTSPSRTWEECWWVAKRVYLTDKEGIARFKKKWDGVTLDWSPPESQLSDPSSSAENKASKKAKVWEIWNKRDRKVIWVTESSHDDILEEIDDPLKLEGFYPCPKPLCATLTNETMVPVPDYYEYQDQAVELDDLTMRISSLTKAIKAAGVYDASLPELQRMLEEGFENKLVPTENWTTFTTNMGASGMGGIWLLPIKDMAAVLIQLYAARDQVKQTLYEITGLSDIVRGQSGAGGAPTATEQRIKGQFASMRLNDMQSDVARFARDTLRIMGEVIAEHYSDRTLMLISSYAQYAKEQFLPGNGAPQGAPPMMGHNGPMTSPSVLPQGVGAGGAGSMLPGSAPQPMVNGMGGPPIMLPPPPQMVAAQKAADLFTKSVGLLRNDKLRGFRIEIETDSLIEPDQQATQQARAELMGAISQFLPQAIQAGAASPELKPLLARLLMFFLRGFKASRDIESAFEQFIDDMEQQAKNPQPKPSSPEQIKAQAEQAKIKADAEARQQEALIRQQEAQADMAMEQQKGELKRQELIMEFEHAQRMLGLKEREAMIGFQTKVQTAQIDAESAERQASIDATSQANQAAADEHAHQLGMEATDHKHEVGIEMLDAKAKATKAAANRPSAGK